MKIYDITLPLKAGMPAYPGDPAFDCRVVSSLENADSSELSLITMGSHAGTHIDAPAHMIEGGRRLDDISPEILIGPARVFDMRGIEGHISAVHLQNQEWKGVERALFFTRNSERWAAGQKFDEKFTALTGDAAEFLVEKKLKLVGVDGLSVDRFKSGTHPAHMPLLKAGIVILEGLNLSAVPAGDYQLLCAPLKIEGGDGAPARVFLATHNRCQAR